MRRTIVVFGILVAFLCATFGAYAVENSTWGRIKASFVESPEKATGDLQLLPGEAFQDRAAKRVKRARDPSMTTKFIRAKRGGRLGVDVGWAKMSLTIKRGALAGDAAVSLYIRRGSDGVPWFGVQALPHRTCSPPAELKIEATIPLAYLLDNLALVHGVNTGVQPISYGSTDGATATASSWEPVVAGIEVTVDEEAGTATLKITAYLPGFSRYALGSSR